jgi:hypothetical protein
VRKIIQFTAGEKKGSWKKGERKRIQFMAGGDKKDLGRKSTVEKKESSL